MEVRQLIEILKKYHEETLVFIPAQKVTYIQLLTEPFVDDVKVKWDPKDGFVLDENGPVPGICIG